MWTLSSNKHLRWRILYWHCELGWLSVCVYWVCYRIFYRISGFCSLDGSRTSKFNSEKGIQTLSNVLWGPDTPDEHWPQCVSLTDLIWLEAQSPFFPLAWKFKKEVWTMEVCSWTPTFAFISNLSHTEASLHLFREHYWIFRVLGTIQGRAHQGRRLAGWIITYDN